jgi:muramoyltetrapeptide carboxypeptidase LdcA involved in peptidoglycan recycling
MKYARMFSTPPIAAIFTFVGGLFIASILNLIVAAIMKKDKEVSFNNY